MSTAFYGPKFYILSHRILTKLVSKCTKESVFEKSQRSVCIRKNMFEILVYMKLTFSMSFGSTAKLPKSNFRMHAVTIICINKSTKWKHLKANASSHFAFYKLAAWDTP